MRSRNGRFAAIGLLLVVTIAPADEGTFASGTEAVVEQLAGIKAELRSISTLLAAVESERLEDGLSADPQGEPMRRELDLMRHQRENLEARAEAARGRTIERENDLARARDDIATLAEAVDEKLGLR